MPSKVYITGSGVISAIGIGKSQTLDSLLQGRSGVGKPHLLRLLHPELPVGEVPIGDDALMERLGYDKSKPYNRTILLGISALKEALEEAGLSEDDIRKASLVSGTTVGGMDKSECFYKSFLSDSDRYTRYLKLHDCGATTDAIADYFKGFSFATTLSTACSSAANAVIFGAELIKSGRASIVAVGGCECLSNFHLCGFNTLMILDSRPCRPFDASRNGLNLGEGAAYLILESEESVMGRSVKPLAALAGYGNACDAFHQTASSDDGEGAFLAMDKALKMAGIPASCVDYVNAHGTGTPNNDISESAALRRIFTGGVPPVSSTKSYTGHTTSASGSIESVICLLALREGMIPSSLNWSEPDEGCIKPFVSEDLKREVRTVMNNSFGFGGNDSSLIFTKAD